MNFKEALIAHLQGERVEVFTQFPAFDKPQDGQYKWRSFGDFYSSFEVGDADDYSEDSGDEYRLAPRTIMCNGVEVPAPESVAPRYSVQYFIPDILCDDLYDTTFWSSESQDGLRLERGLVYLNKEDAIARAKAMLIVQEVK